MKNFILSLMICLFCTSAFAVTESGSNDAQSVVLYGKQSNGTLTPLLVDGTGVVSTSSGWTKSGTNVTLTTSTDNVGIGSATPSAKLSIEAASGNAVFITNSGTQRYLLGATGQFQDNANTGSTAVTITNAGAGDLANFGSGKFYVTNGGNVGIGTTDPQGAFTVTSGNVGIGTWVPTAKLTIGGTGQITALGDGTNTSTNIMFTGSRGFIGYDGNNMVLQGGTGKGIKITANNASFGSGTASIYIDGTSGNVGIGTLVPGADLEVANASGANLIVSRPGFPSGKQTFTAGSSGGTWASAGTIAVTSGGSSVWSADSARFCLGATQTSNTTRFQVNGAGAIGGTYYTLNAPTNGAIIEGTVGIGTATPTQTLEVKGTLSVRGAQTSPWTKKTGANTACDTTCGLSMCAFGEDTGVLGTLLACSDNTADVCICMGP